MKNIVKKIAIYSMVGIMQIGLGASVIEASPLHNDFPKPAAYEQHQDRYDHERMEQERHERKRIENERHEREMQRHPGESRKHWRERQKVENERHQHEMERIRHEFEHGGR